MEPHKGKYGQVSVHMGKYDTIYDKLCQIWLNCIIYEYILTGKCCHITVNVSHNGKCCHITVNVSHNGKCGT